MTEYVFTRDYRSNEFEFWAEKGTVFSDYDDIEPDLVNYLLNYGIVRPVGVEPEEQVESKPKQSKRR